jgi:hypothetical protein
VDVYSDFTIPAFSRHVTLLMPHRHKLLDLICITVLLSCLTYCGWTRYQATKLPNLGSWLCVAQTVETLEASSGPKASGL